MGGTQDDIQAKAQEDNDSKVTAQANSQMDNLLSEIPVPNVNDNVTVHKWTAAAAGIAYEDHQGIMQNSTDVSFGAVEKGAGFNFIAKVDFNSDGTPELTARGVDGTITITQGETQTVLTGEQAEQFKTAIRTFSRAEIENVPPNETKEQKTKRALSYSNIAQLLEDPSPATVGKVIKTFQPAAQSATSRY